MPIHSLDVVIPIHNELSNVMKMILAMEEIVSPLFIKTRLIFVDDGSTDGTFNLFKSLKPDYSLTITYLKFSKNFKKDMAVKCGIDYSNADYCAVIDGDLQQPPGAIIEAYNIAQKGYDIIHIMKSEYKTSFVRKIGSDTFAFFINSFAGFRIHLSDYKLFSQKVAKELSLHTEKSLFFAGSIELLGFNSTKIHYQVNDRTSGKSKFSIGSLIVLAIKSIVSISVKPLRLASLFGLILSAGSFIFTLWIVIENFMLSQPILGFTTIAGGIFLLGGLQLLFLGIIGEYIGQIYIEIKNRKQYIIEEEIFIEKNSN